MNRPVRFLLMALAACPLAACGSSEPSPDLLADVVDDNPALDLAGDLPAETGDTASDTQACDGTPFHGFCVRVPEKHVVSSSEIWDLDQLCTYASGKTPGYFYVQATPSALDNPTGANYTTVGAWVSFNDVAQKVTATYDGGGNHRNDACEIVFDSTVLRYYHSSFGFGWRCCQPMDCFQVLAGPAGAVTDNGCGVDRTHPVVCVKVQQDGTWAALVDTFAMCAGDPNGPP